MSHETLDYRQKLRSAGYRVTRQRVVILDAVCAGHGHTTLKQVFARVQQVDKSIDQSSLYRTLKLYAELGIVVSATTEDGEMTYEIAHAQPHHHLVCRTCGSQQEISDGVIQIMSNILFKTYGFQARQDHMVISGLCSRCRQPSGD